MFYDNYANPAFQAGELGVGGTVVQPTKGVDRWGGSGSMNNDVGPSIEHHQTPTTCAEQQRGAVIGHDAIVGSNGNDNVNMDASTHERTRKDDHQDDDLGVEEDYGLLLLQLKRKVVVASPRRPSGGGGTVPPIGATTSTGTRTPPSSSDDAITAKKQFGAHQLQCKKRTLHCRSISPEEKKEDGRKTTGGKAKSLRLAKTNAIPKVVSMTEPVSAAATTNRFEAAITSVHSTVAAAIAIAGLVQGTDAVAGTRTGTLQPHHPPMGTETTPSSTVSARGCPPHHREPVQSPTPLVGVAQTSPTTTTATATTMGSIVAAPHQHDVLCGRGKLVSSHAGNKHFLSLVKMHRHVYVAASKSEKKLFARLIVEAITGLDPPGRFLKQDGATQLWHEVSHKKALDKTRQALREGAPELMVEISSSTKNNKSSDVGERQVTSPPLVRVVGLQTKAAGSCDAHIQGTSCRSA